MGYSQNQLIVRLKDLQIKFSLYEHPAVLMAETQAKLVGHFGGGVSKNLFLKDKKHRFYIVSALADTKVDMKVLSQRLGLGKGGLRMAPEEALDIILQVPPGCVTPFALINESARDVTLLIDQRLRTKDHCFFNNLSNGLSISLDVSQLDKFLKAIGKESRYVDFEACPSVGKDEPPDLADFVSASAPVLELVEKQDILKSSEAVAEKTVQHCKSSSADGVGFADPARFVEEAVEKIAQALRKNGTQQEDVDMLKKLLGSELEGLAVTFKNKAYGEGFHAGKWTRAHGLSLY